MRLEWRDSALNDLDEITQYIAERNPRAAEDLVTHIVTLAQRLLPANPYLGRATQGGARELVVHKNYVLAYRVTENAIQIQAIRHTARNPG